MPKEHKSCGGRLVSPDGRDLPLRGAEIRVEAGGGIARAVLEQRFEPAVGSVAETLLSPSSRCAPPAGAR